MKDTALRGIILAKYYERRREPYFLPKSEEFSPPISTEDICAVADQLGQHGLIAWKAIRSHGNVSFGLGKITAHGIDVVEGASKPEIVVEFVQNKNIHVASSSNVIIGDNNQMTVSQHISELVRLIDASSGTPEQKAEAKSLLSRFAEHPLVVAVAGVAASALIGAA